jgi:hypothetical protein
MRRIVWYVFVPDLISRGQEHGFNAVHVGLSRIEVRGYPLCWYGLAGAMDVVYRDGSVDVGCVLQIAVGSTTSLGSGLAFSGMFKRLNGKMRLFHVSREYRTVAVHSKGGMRCAICKALVPGIPDAMTSY